MKEMKEKHDPMHDKKMGSKTPAKMMADKIKERQKGNKK